MNVEGINLLFNKFMDNDVLKIDELLSLGISEDEIYEMVNNGLLRHFSLYSFSLSNNVDDYLKFSKFLNKNKKFKEAIFISKKCLDIAPNNRDVCLMLFYDSVYAKDFDEAYNCLDILIDGCPNNNSRMREYNFWLYLLSFVSDVPDKYREKIKNMQFSDIYVSKYDKRFSDVFCENRIRTAAFNKNFGAAISLINDRMGDTNISIAICNKLCYLAANSYKKTTDKLFSIISGDEYMEAISILDESRKYWELSSSEKAIYSMLKDIILLRNDGVVPKSVECESDDVLELVFSRNYKKAKEVNDNTLSTHKRNKSITYLLGKINYHLELVDNYSESNDTDLAKTIVISEDDEKQLFARITSHLMRYDVDSAFELLDQYLNMVDCLEYKRYICDLIKLSVLNKEKGFVDPMHSLSLIARGEYEFDVSNYIQDFYFSLVDKDFSKAAIYLDILALSHTIGGIYIDISDMRDVLIDDMKRSGIDSKKEGIIIPEVMENSGYVPKKRRVVSNINNDSNNFNNVRSADSSVILEEHNESCGMEDETSILDGAIDKSIFENEEVEELLVESSEETLEEEEDDYIYTISDVIGEVLENSNLIMLDAMDDEQIGTVLGTVSGISKIQSKVVEYNGEKHIVLRYYDKDLPYIDIPGVLREAGRRYGNWEYSDAIDLYQSVLPKLESPRAYIYKNLGFLYQKTSYDGDYSKAIDYLTMAMEQSKSESEEYDFTEIIEDLKKKSNYNGVVLSDTDGGYQYKKK